MTDVTVESTAEDTANLERMAARVDTLLEQAAQFRRVGSNGEADAALARAEHIMIKYSINAAQAAAARRGEPVEYDQVTLRYTGIYRQATLRGVYSIIDALGTCRAFQQRRGNVDQLVVIGQAADVRFARVLATSVEQQALTQMRRWWATYDRSQLGSMAAYKARREYVSSFLRGVWLRVQLANQDAVTASGTAVVLADRRRALDRYVDDKFNLVPSRSQLLPGVDDARVAGTSAGLAANTGDTPLTGGRALLEGNH